MAASTPTRLGQVNNAGSDIALFLQIFSGEVLTQFETSLVMRALHMERNIMHGKSASFPVIGKIGSSYHVPGAEILGSAVPQNERIISIDGLLLSHVFIASIDEAMNHFEVRGVYAQEMGRELAKQYDKNVLRNTILAARAAGSVTGEAGGTLLTNALYATDGAALAQGIFDAAVALSEKDNPDTDLHAVFKPAQYALLAQNTNVINKDWDGNGSYSKGKVIELGGIMIHKTNNAPFATNDTANTAIPAAYRADWTNTRGVVFHKGAVGTVTLLDVATEDQYDARRQGTLIVSKYASGHGVLRALSAVEMKIA